VKAIRFGTAAAFAVLASTAAFADDVRVGPFAKFFGPDAPQCMPISEVAKVSTSIDLTPEQFQFARALFVAIPPVSHDLPVGDHAVMATAGGVIMIALVDGQQTCARFVAPDFVRTMLMKVGEGEDGVAGVPM
jgi:hypothetical protein